MQKQGRRTPKNYDGTALTTHKVSDILDTIINRIRDRYEERPDLVLQGWKEVIGPKLSGMAEAMSFEEGVLFVKVKNSTLHSLLSTNDKPRVLAALRQKFPRVTIKNIIFRIG